MVMWWKSTDEEELKYWRNSAGLLGIILAVEFEVIQDTGFQMELDCQDLRHEFRRVLLFHCHGYRHSSRHE